MEDRTKITLRMAWYLWLSLINFTVWTDPASYPILFFIAFAAQFFMLYGIVDELGKLLELIQKEKRGTK